MRWVSVVRVLKLIMKLSMTATLTVACIPALWMLLSCFESQIVLFQAARVAGNRLYCIVVPENGPPFNYREVKSQSELSYFNLTTYLDQGGTSGPFAETYYALLILQKPDDVWNWS